ncbi:Cp190 family protein [Megaselia abdita]
MGEIKSVKVDNWGVFFLQKLQNFFNKTDYCDMTLQFNDNSQLKVHRLVLSACTDYFNLLETNCEQIDDAVVMPNDLQADVVVPIVNFMYTGTLEFELNMYNKLLRTARDMNMTVLLKLLEAHRRTMEQSSALNKPQQNTTQIRGRPYPTTLSPTKQVTMQRSITTQIPGGKMLSTNIARGPAPAPPRRHFAMFKEEVSFDPSPFEQLRQSGVNYKRPASKAYETPPEKKPSIEDVKEFAEQQRMRKQIAAAEISGIPGEDEYVESYMEDEFPQDDEEEEMNISGSQITIKQEPNQKPTIVFKASADSKMDHAKIIGEVLKKYPHLIKNNKNLKLKIMPNSGTSQQQKIIVKKEDVEIQQKPVVLPVSVPKPSPNAVVQKPAGSTKKIDSRTMHSLIALGAENTTGPWLCLRCGVNGRPISIPSYRGFRRHLINSHREKIDARLCEHCGYRSSDVRDLHFHVQVEHQITSTSFTFPRCEYCALFFVTTTVLNKHIEESHTKNQQCIYCNEVYPKENDLYNHMKLAHKKQAQSDGVIDFSEGEEENEFLTFNKVEDSKIKILSDISLPTTSVAVNEGTKFVTADGSEMVLSEEQRDQLMAQLDPNQEGGGIIMVLNESFSEPAEQQHVEETSVVIEQGQVQEQSIEEKHESENMFVYKEIEAEEDQLERKLEEQLEEEMNNAEVNDELQHEQVENTEHKMDVEEQEEEKQPEASTSEDEKLKMITGEWTDDEPEEDNVEDNSKQQKIIAEEEVAEENPDESHHIIDEEGNEVRDETDENIKEDLTDGANLASPLKQELLEFLGMENIEDSILENKVSEVKEAEAKPTDDQKGGEEIQEEVKEEADQSGELVAEKSTTEEIEDELAQLREELEKNEKEEKEDKEKKPVQEADSKEISDSELQEQLEHEEEIKETSVTQQVEGDTEKTEIKPDEKIDKTEEAVGEDEKGKISPEQSKDALKSIITDWEDEGEGQDDDL